jgi:mannosyltransferase OCH1-like enzyme
MSLKSLLIPSLNRPPAREYIAALPEGTSIPRIIHQVGMRPAFENRQIPPLFEKNIEKMKALNPGWEFRFYGDDEIEAFIKGNYPPEIWAYYERIDPRYGPARADLFRYLLLYKVGGVYLDIKSSATLPLDSVLRPDDRYILSKWHSADGQFEHWGLVFDLRDLLGGEFQQWHVISAPGHPYLKAVIEQVLFNIDHYLPSLHQAGKNGTLRLTGPIPYTLAIERIREKHPHRMVDGRNVFGLEYNIIDGDQGHAKIFKGHYTRQTAPVVRLTPFKHVSNQFYKLVQLTYDHTLRRYTDAKLAPIDKPASVLAREAAEIAKREEAKRAQREISKAQRR